MAYPVSAFLLVCIVHFMQVGSTAFPTPPNPTDRLNQRYVTSEKENESCFYETGKPIPEGLYLRCGPGYHAQIGDSRSPCHLCTLNETLKTYQPKENYCEKCIVCTNCTALGMEVEANCTVTTDTVCKDPQNSGDALTTDTKVQYRSSPSTPLDVPVATSPTMQRNKTDSPDCPTCIQYVEQKLSWIIKALLGLLAVTPVLLLCFGCYKRKTYKSKIGQLKEQIRNPQKVCNGNADQPNPDEDEVCNGNADQPNPDEDDNEDIALNHFPAVEAEVHNGNAHQPSSDEDDNGPASTEPLLSNNEDIALNHFPAADPEVHDGNADQPNHDEYDNAPASTEPLLANNDIVLNHVPAVESTV